MWYISCDWWANIDTWIITKVHSLHKGSFLCVCCIFYGVDKWIMTCICHYRVIQNSLKIPCAPLSQPSLATTYLFIVSIVWPYFSIFFCGLIASFFFCWLILHYMDLQQLFYLPTEGESYISNTRNRVPLFCFHSDEFLGQGGWWINELKLGPEIQR